MLLSTWKNSQIIKAVQKWDWCTFKVFQAMSAFSFAVAGLLGGG